MSNKLYNKIGLISTTLIAVVTLSAGWLSSSPSASAAPRPATERHDDCVGPTNGNLGEVYLTNNCREQVDLKWCYIRNNGGDAGCRFAAPLNPGFQVNTPQCYQCSYKVVWEAFLTSDRARGEFSSNGALLRQLQSE
jgi:hypothetical protein